MAICQLTWRIDESPVKWKDTPIRHLSTMDADCVKFRFLCGIQVLAWGCPTTKMDVRGAGHGPRTPNHPVVNTAFTHTLESPRALVRQAQEDR